MKNVSLFSILFLGAISFGADVENTQPEEILIPLERAYTPVGFDTNDNIQVTVSGHLPDTCHTVGKTVVEVVSTPAASKVVLHQTAYRYNGGLTCIRVPVPFAKTVDIGIVKTAANYTITSSSGKLDGNYLTIGNLEVKAATSPRQDEKLYAPISETFITTDTGSNVLSMRGEFPLDTMRLKGAPTVEIYRKEKVIVVIVETENTGVKQATTRFAATADLGNSLQGDYLVHIRKMDGQAINFMYRFGGTAEWLR